MVQYAPENASSVHRVGQVGSGQPLDSQRQIVGVQTYQRSDQHSDQRSDQHSDQRSDGVTPGGHGFALRTAGTPRGVLAEGSRIIDPTDISGISERLKIDIKITRCSPPYTSCPTTALKPIAK